MRRIPILALLTLCLIPQGCKRVSIQFENDDPFSITVPMFVVFQALRFTDEDVLKIDDLGGIDQEIPLHVIAQAIRDGGDQIKVDYREGTTRIKAEKRGRIFHIQIEDTQEEERVLLQLPDSLVYALLTSKNGQINQRKIKKALKRFSGVLLEIESPDERLRIVLR